jgi:hypothetical protein
LVDTRQRVAFARSTKTDTGRAKREPARVMSCKGVDEGRVEADAAEAGVEAAAEDVRRVGVAEAFGGHLEGDVGGLDLDPGASGELETGRVGDAG